MNAALTKADGTAITALVVSANFDSAPIELARSGREGRVSVNLAWTGAGTGTFQFLVSNDDPRAGAISEASLSQLTSVATTDGSPIHRDIETEAAVLIVRFVSSGGNITLTGRVNSNARGD
jgi:hypothetical protein